MTRTDQIREYLRLLDNHGRCNGPIDWDTLKKIAFTDEEQKDHNLKDDSDLPEYFVTAQSLHYMNRVEMQAAWQRHIDASISSTVNVPNSFTTEDVGNLYIQAWKNGLKGITLFTKAEKSLIHNNFSA